MTNEELVIEIKAGHTEYLEQLWLQCRRFVWKQAYGWLCRNSSSNNLLFLELDDLIQSGFLTMLKTIKYFKPEKGFTFIGCLGRALPGGFTDTAGTKKRDASLHAVDIDEPIKDNDDITLRDAIEDPEADINEIVEKTTLSKDIQKAVADLPEDERELINLVYFRRMSVTDAAVKIGATVDAGYLHKKSLEHLRRGRYGELLRGYAEIKPEDNTAHPKIDFSDEYTDALTAELEALKTMMAGEGV